MVGPTAVRPAAAVVVWEYPDHLHLQPRAARVAAQVGVDDRHRPAAVAPVAADDEEEDPAELLLPGAAIIGAQPWSNKLRWRRLRWSISNTYPATAPLPPAAAARRAAASASSACTDTSKAYG